jgi:23S rRNA (adenine1618-N6)-methyltransferase
MAEIKKEHPEVKTSLHPLNKHRGRYDFDVLIKRCPELSEFVSENKYGDLSVDFFDTKAVKTLNTALLFEYYGLTHWEIPEGFLCPPIPGRADYIHHIAELLGNSNGGNIPTRDKIVCLDIGVGASCIYSIIGASEYGWSFIGSDIDAAAIASANQIINANPSLKKLVSCRLQLDTTQTFSGIIKPTERIDLSICNPPFHASLEEANAGNLRKLSNLKHKKITKPALNFGGRGGELWTEGGEKQFILKMILQSAAFDKRCFWFSTLVSKHGNLKPIQIALKNSQATSYKTIEMGQGNKTSRLVAWTFLTRAEQAAWAEQRWV